MAFRSIIQHAIKSTSGSVSALTANNVRFYSRFVNQVNLLGRVGREPARVGTKDAVAFPFYTESTMKLADGSVKTYPSWHRVVVFRKGLAEIVMENVERGQRCYVTGRIVYRAPERKEDGKLVANHQAAIMAETVVFLDKSRRVRDPEDQENTSEPKGFRDEIAV